MQLSVQHILAYLRVGPDAPLWVWDRETKQLLCGGSDGLPAAGAIEQLCSSNCDGMRLVGETFEAAIQVRLYAHGAAAVAGTPWAMHCAISPLVALGFNTKWLNSSSTAQAMMCSWFKTNMRSAGVPPALAALPRRSVPWYWTSGPKDTVDEWAAAVRHLDQDAEHAGATLCAWRDLAAVGCAPSWVWTGDVQLLDWWKRSASGPREKLVALSKMALTVPLYIPGWNPATETSFARWMNQTVAANGAHQALPPAFAAEFSECPLVGAWGNCLRRASSPPVPSTRAQEVFLTVGCSDWDTWDAARAAIDAVLAACAKTPPPAAVDLSGAYDAFSGASVFGMDAIVNILTAGQLQGTVQALCTGGAGEPIDGADHLRSVLPDGVACPQTWQDLPALTAALGALEAPKDIVWKGERSDFWLMQLFPGLRSAWWARASNDPDPPAAKRQKTPADAAMSAADDLGIAGGIKNLPPWFSGHCSPDGVVSAQGVAALGRCRCLQHAGCAVHKRFKVHCAEMLKGPAHVTALAAAADGLCPLVERGGNPTAPMTPSSR